MFLISYSAFFSFVVIYFYGGIVNVEALKSGDDGVCIAKLSVPKTRIKVFTTNKQCGKKKCVSRRKETYTVQELRTVCCNGWEYNVHNDACTPICSTGCVGGKCAAPEICRCEPPATLDPEHKNTCIRPTCDPPCVNALCGFNNTCHCNPDFTAYNGTHCTKCDSGYSLDKDNKCVPICNKACIYGNCTKPNQCSCFDGYILKSKDNFTCEPFCDNCVNSTCVAPNKCSCLEGFKRYNDSVCEPNCEKCGGECIGPNLCSCRKGFVNIDGVCKPICEGACQNGICSMSGVCLCNVGFVKNASNPEACVKNCHYPGITEITSPVGQIIKKCSWEFPRAMTVALQPSESQNELNQLS